jgi:hypothetical protein
MGDMERLVLILTAGLVVLALYTFQRDGQPDPQLISLAVRATVYAMPSPSPQVIEVTRVVEVTRMVEIVRVVEVTATVQATATAAASITPGVAPQAAIPPEVATPEAPTSVAAEPAVEVAMAASEAEPLAEVQSELQTQIQAEPQAAFETANSGACPASSGQQYNSIPVSGPSASHPDAQHGDLNLALRGYVPTDASLSLVDINGPTDGDAPQLAGVLGRLPSFGRVYRARDWNWGCGDLGCRGEEIGSVEVSLVALQSSPGEAVHVPSRGAEIYGGGYVALVLYADSSRLTVVYTREDTVANGYAVHLEDFCVDPNLLALYQANNGAGRGSLPAVRNGESVGSARYDSVLVGVRDRGTFTDPRSRKDWWRGY